ncbi:hypothetical protein DNTS_000645 [Danionella cerebrum]|uniref:Uncharacterized protein n=1 Tax=Danionella cerebrum TaxID=2873325 RepID=A0A553QAI9_9TELE|nr:hypothetical protein DNTS_000645 [Danionella translucida]
MEKKNLKIRGQDQLTCDDARKGPDASGDCHQGGFISAPLIFREHLLHTLVHGHCQNPLPDLLSLLHLEHMEHEEFTQEFQTQRIQSALTVMWSFEAKSKKRLRNIKAMFSHPTACVRNIHEQLAAQKENTHQLLNAFGSGASCIVVSNQQHLLKLLMGCGIGFRRFGQVFTLHGTELLINTDGRVSDYRTHQEQEHIPQIGPHPKSFCTIPTLEAYKLQEHPLSDFSDSKRVISPPPSHIVGSGVVRGDQSAQGSPWIQLLGHSFGFVPFFALDECVYGVLNEVQVEIAVDSSRILACLFPLPSLRNHPLYPPNSPFMSAAVTRLMMSLFDSSSSRLMANQAALAGSPAFRVEQEQNHRGCTVLRSLTSQRCGVVEPPGRAYSGSSTWLRSLTTSLGFLEMLWPCGTLAENKRPLETNTALKTVHQRMQVLPVIIPIINGSAKLNQPLIQSVGDRVNPFSHNDLSFTIGSFQVYNITLQTLCSKPIPFLSLLIIQYNHSIDRAHCKLSIVWSPSHAVWPTSGKDYAGRCQPSCSCPFNLQLKSSCEYIRDGFRDRPAVPLYETPGLHFPQQKQQQQQQQQQQEKMAQHMTVACGEDTEHR